MVFEAIGTFVLTMIIGGLIADGNIYSWNDESEHSHCYPIQQGPLLFGLWVLIVFGFKISGSHYNPAITLAFMFRRDVGNFNRATGILYIASQIGGAILAGITLALTFGGAHTIISTPNGEIHEYNRFLMFPTRNFFVAWISECLGSFLLIFFFLTQTEKSTLYAKEESINAMIISGAYVASRSVAGNTLVTCSGSILNPAIALGIMIGGIDFTYSFLYLTAPFAAAVGAVFFLEFVFKKT